MTIDLMKRPSDLLARRGKDADLKKMGIVPFSPFFKKRRTVPFLEEYVRCRQIL